ncbi:MAG: glycosyltransferase family 4 protein [Elusimicrobiaceae bacterium]|nr:glycosyltransferase family 4 protein [Elusimicrobiaceae bacterium]
MHIFVVSQCFYPDNYHINQIVQDLVARGHQITVLTGKPDYTTGRVPAEYKGFKKYHDSLGKVEVWRVPIYARRKGALNRFINYLSFMVNGSVLALLKKWENFDVIYVWGASPITMAIPAIWLKKRYHKPLFFYCLDLWPESMKAFHVSEKNPIFQLVRLFCKWIYKQFDQVAVTSKPFMQYIETVNGVPASKQVYLPQYGAESYLTRDFTAQQNGVIDLLFAGNIGFVQDIDKIIAAAALLKDVPGWQIHIVGDGSAKAHFEQVSAQMGLTERVLFHGRVPLNQMERFYKLADACLLTLAGNTKIGDTLPVKMQGYMAAGKPVLAAINGAGKEVIEQSGCGLVVPAGDVDGLARIMRQFITDPVFYASCGARGREYFKQHFTKETHLTQLETYFTQLRAVYP